MNKAEIIRKISKKAGVPDTEAKKFFEIFLKNASDLLKPGESLKISGVGLFQLRVGQIENRTKRNTEDQYIYSDLIVFINQDPDEEKEGEEEVIFNVPSVIEEAGQFIDSYFSLSIGKPIIPLKGARDSEFYIPVSGTELLSLLDSKIAKLLEEAEKVEGGKETETIHIKKIGEESDEITGREKRGTEDFPEEIEVPSRSDFLKTREFENLSWDFGENLSQEIEEESVTDTEGEPYKENEAGAVDKTETEPVFEEEAADEEATDEVIFEEISDNQSEEEIFEETAGGLTDTSADTWTEESEDKFSDVSAVKEKITYPEDLTPEDEDKNNDVSAKFETEETALKNFQRVKSLTKEFNSTEFNNTGDIEEEKPKKIIEVRGGYQKVRRTTAEFDFDLSGIEGLDEIEEPPVKIKKSVHREYQGYRKQSRVPSLIVAFIVVVSLGVVIFLYLKMKTANNETSAEGPSTPANQETRIIERGYDVPVTYPYDKPGKDATSDSIGTASEQAGTKEKMTGAETPADNNEVDLSEIRDAVNAERIGSYIYKYPEGIVVQVSSWKSKAIAVSEVQKYRNAGYTAFAETSNISGRGLYYRVRVGYFSSVQEAQKFLNGNQ